MKSRPLHSLLHADCDRRGSEEGPEVAKEGPKFREEQPDLEALGPDAVAAFHEAKDEVCKGDLRY